MKTQLIELVHATAVYLRTAPVGELLAIWIAGIFLLMLFAYHMTFRGR